MLAWRSLLELRGALLSFTFDGVTVLVVCFFLGGVVNEGGGGAYGGRL